MRRVQSRRPGEVPQLAAHTETIQSEKFLWCGRRQTCTCKQTFKAKIYYAIQLGGSRAGLQPASELDSIMEFGLSRTIQLTSTSATSSQLGFRLVADRFKLSPHDEIARTWPQTGSQLVCDQHASWSATWNWKLHHKCLDNKVCSLQPIISTEP